MAIGFIILGVSLYTLFVYYKKTPYTILSKYSYCIYIYLNCPCCDGLRIWSVKTPIHFIYVVRAAKSRRTCKNPYDDMSGQRAVVDLNLLFQQ